MTPPEKAQVRAAEIAADWWTETERLRSMVMTPPEDDTREQRAERIDRYRSSCQARTAGLSDEQVECIMFGLAFVSDGALRRELSRRSGGRVEFVYR